MEEVSSELLYNLKKKTVNAQSFKAHISKRQRSWHSILSLGLKSWTSDGNPRRYSIEWHGLKEMSIWLSFPAETTQMFRKLETTVYICHITMQLRDNECMGLDLLVFQTLQTTLSFNDDKHWLQSLNQIKNISLQMHNSFKHSFWLTKSPNLLSQSHWNTYSCKFIPHIQRHKDFVIGKLNYGVLCTSSFHSRLLLIHQKAISKYTDKERAFVPTLGSHLRKFIYFKKCAQIKGTWSETKAFLLSLSTYTEVSCHLLIVVPKMYLL